MFGVLAPREGDDRAAEARVDSCLVVAITEIKTRSKFEIPFFFANAREMNTSKEASCPSSRAYTFAVKFEPKSTLGDDDDDAPSSFLFKRPREEKRDDEDVFSSSVSSASSALVTAVISRDA